MATTWLRIQEEPLVLTVALVASIVSGANLIGRLNVMSVFAAMFYAALMIGGVQTVWGRLADNLALESAGLALMIGGYAFTTLRKLALAADAVDVTSASLNGGVLALGLLIRLHVVRKAQRIRRSTARRLT